MFGTKKKKVSEKELRAIAWEEFKKEMLPKMNISTKADKSLLDQYIVTYWYIDGEAKIYNEIYNRVKSENS